MLRYETQAFQKLQHHKLVLQFCLICYLLVLVESFMITNFNLNYYLENRAFCWLDFTPRVQKARMNQHLNFHETY